MSAKGEAPGRGRARSCFRVLIHLPGEPWGRVDRPKTFSEGIGLVGVGRGRRLRPAFDHVPNRL